MEASAKLFKHCTIVYIRHSTRQEYHRGQWSQALLNSSSRSYVVYIKVSISIQQAAVPLQTRFYNHHHQAADQEAPGVVAESDSDEKYQYRLQRRPQ